MSCIFPGTGRGNFRALSSDGKRISETRTTTPEPPTPTAKESVPTWSEGVADSKQGLPYRVLLLNPAFRNACRAVSRLQPGKQAVLRSKMRCSRKSSFLLEPADSAMMRVDRRHRS